MIRALAAVGSIAIALAAPASSAQNRKATAVQAAPTPAARASAAKVVTLKITGMTCGGCAIAARKVLARLDGVSKAEVSYEKKEAVVTYDASKVTVEQMIAAVKTLGYTAVQGS